MKLAFNTLGCPKWTLDEIIQRAKAWGYDGVELRGIQDEMFLPNHPELAPQKRSETLQKFEDAGLKVVCVSASARMGVPESEAQKHLDEGKAYIELAAALKCEVVRVFGGNRPEGMTSETHFALVAERLQKLSEFAKPLNVKVAIETHDAFVKGKDVAEVLAKVSAENAGMLWDVHHSVRAGETPAETVALIGKRIFATHFKDSVRKERRIQYVPVGQGEIPLRDALKALRQIGYQGFITLEWEKRWHPELEEPEVVFPQFVTVMRVWLKELNEHRNP